jgi:hypothetical protein
LEDERIFVKILDTCYNRGINSFSKREREKGKW